MFEGWQYTTNLKSHYNSRVWLVWKPDVYKVACISSSGHVITYEVCYVPLQLKYMMSVVYAYNTREERKELWEALVHHSLGCVKPWMILGDFNSVLKMDDRLDCNLVTWSMAFAFQDCVDTCGMI